MTYVSYQVKLSFTKQQIINTYLHFFCLATASEWKGEDHYCQCGEGFQ